MTDSEDEDSETNEGDQEQTPKVSETRGSKPAPSATTYRPPEDGQWRQMNAYYRMLTCKFEYRKDSWDEDGRRKV